MTDALSKFYNHWPTLNLNIPLAALWGRWFYGINHSKDWEIVVKRLDGLGINFAHIMQMNLGKDKG